VASGRVRPKPFRAAARNNVFAPDKVPAQAVPPLLNVWIICSVKSFFGTKIGLKAHNAAAGARFTAKSSSL
jgi:hypothetical protein